MAKKNRQVVYLYRETSKNLTAQVRGGKGLGLAEMSALGLNIPPGFTLTTSVARAFSQEACLPKRVAWHLERGVRALERETGKGLGNSENPLLVSIRSGAAVSMPGMMDTILNLGLNPETVEGLARQSGERFAFDCYRRFLAQFGQTALGIGRERFIDTDVELSVPALRELCESYRAVIAEQTGRPMVDDPLEQMALAIFAVLASWDSERAVAYRIAHNIPHWWGTAVNVQAMVFGNHGHNSGTGVVFSRNVATGAPGLYGEFLPEAQGEDVVAGVRTPLPIAEMQSWNGALYSELDEQVKLLELHYGDIVDVEFTVEQGRLYILQSRRAKRTAEAAAVYAVQRVWEKSLTRGQALELVTLEQAEQLRRPVFNSKAIAGATAIVSGLAASPGVTVGKVAYSSAKAQEYKASGESAVLVRKDTSPDDLPGMIASVAVVTETGGATSHAAVVARGMGLPAVVGTGSTLEIAEGEIVSVDGSTGMVYRGALPLTGGSARKEVRIFLRWLEGEIPVWPAPRADFSKTKEKFSMNKILNDFYLTDAMAQASVGSPLASEAEKLKRETHIGAAEILACYLAIAVAGELRHSSNRADLNKEGRKLLKTLAEEFSLQQGGDRFCVQMETVDTLRKDPKRLPRFFQSAVEIFSADWESGYGGNAWARIARAPYEFLSGRLTHSVFIDHVFDLRHNGGVMFDKHPMCKQRTLENDLLHQLEDKKHATDVGKLHSVLARSSTFSPAVETLFKRGNQQGLW